MAPPPLSMLPPVVPAHQAARPAQKQLTTAHHTGCMLSCYRHTITTLGLVCQVQVIYARALPYAWPSPRRGNCLAISTPTCCRTDESSPYGWLAIASSPGRCRRRHTPMPSSAATGSSTAAKAIGIPLGRMGGGICAGSRSGRHYTLRLIRSGGSSCRSQATASLPMETAKASPGQGQRARNTPQPPGLLCPSVHAALSLSCANTP